MKSKRLFLTDILFEDCKENITECEAAIPDYYPEVFRIVRTNSIPLIQKTALINGRIITEGIIIHSILYVPSDGKGLCSFTIKQPFSCAYESEAEGLYIANAKPQYISCKLSSPRKANIKAVLSVSLKVMGEREINHINPKDDNLLCLNKTMDISCLVAQGQKLFKINEENEIGDNVGAPLYTTATPIVKEARIINGKTIIKGDMQVKTLYVTHKDEIKESFCVFGFSQIIDTPDSMENDNAKVFINVCDIDTQLCAGESENSSVIEYDITARALVQVHRDRKIQLANDCFCVNFETELSKKSAVFSKNCGVTEGSTKTVNKISFADGITRAIDVFGSVRVDTCTHLNRILRIAGSIEAQIIYLNGENEIQSVEKNFPFDAEYATEDIKNLTCRPEVFITGCNLTPVSENEAQISLTLYTFGYLEKRTNCEYISSIEMLKDKPKENTALPPLSLYFAKKGEVIWDIAKNFNISPERIKALNTCDDILSEDKRLLLPRICV